MRTYHVIGGATAVLGALGLAGSALAADATSLGQSVASTASVAEKTVDKPALIRPTVRDAVKKVLVANGPKPTEVISAIDTIFSVCRSPNGVAPPVSWNCPSTEQAYSALLEVRSVVVALLDSPAPASIGGDGPSAFSTFPVTTTSGSAYTQFTDK